MVSCFVAVFALGVDTNVFVFWQKPKLPVPCGDEDQFKAFPKPPAEPREVKNHLAGTQFRLRRAGSLTLLPLERNTIGMQTKLSCFKCDSVKSNMLFDIKISVFS